MMSAYPIFMVGPVIFAFEIIDSSNTCNLLKVPDGISICDKSIF